MGLLLGALDHATTSGRRRKKGSPRIKVLCVIAALLPAHWVTVLPSNAEPVTTSTVPNAPGPLGLGIWQPVYALKNTVTVLQPLHLFISFFFFLTDALYLQHKGPL